MGTLIWVSTVVDLLGALAALAWVRRGSGARLPRALAAAGGATAVWMAKLLVLLELGLRLPFGPINLVYLDAVIVLPLAAAAATARVRRRATALAVLALLVVLPAATGAYASFVEPFRLETERAAVALPAERAGAGRVRVIVLADLQASDVGGHEREAIARAMAERPDLVLLPGDFLQRPASLEQEGPRIRALLRRLHAPGGVFAVLGDVDAPAATTRLLHGTGVRLLVNETATTRAGDRRITIGGLELDYRSPAAALEARRLEAAPGAGDVRMLLAHRPDAAYVLRSRSRVDLVVAGHTHGGQIQVPGLGPLWTASDVPRRVGAGGLHDLAGRRIYVSRGVGVERDQAPRMRFNAPPEVSVLSIR